MYSKYANTDYAKKTKKNPKKTQRYGCKTKTEDNNEKYKTIMCR